MTMTPEIDPQTRDALLAALAWQIELGADECIADLPANRFDEVPPARAKTPAPHQAEQAKPAAPKPPVPAPALSDEEIDPATDEAVADARRLAAAAGSLDALKAAMAGFDGCALKQGAKNTVFADGNPAARIMFIGEAPGRDEDRAGMPFIGPVGALLDRMLGAIGLDRHAEDPAKAAYLTHANPWRPVESAEPSANEALILWAFLERHIALAAPDIIVTLGKFSASTLAERLVRITRERGHWGTPPRAGGRAHLMMLHPAYLLRSPAEKAKAWQDLLSLRAVLDGAAPPIDTTRKE